jgi:SH3-like domain-containing protein
VPGPAVPTPNLELAPVPSAQILYVKTHLANVREGVGTSRRILRVLPQGARLRVLESRANWLRVRLDDGQEGWIAESVTSATAPVTPTRAPAPRPRPPQIARA